MIKNILGTTGTRILNALINLLILIILTNHLGKDGFGNILLIIVAITIIQLFIDLIAGSSIIYFSPRTSNIKLILPSYLWITIIIFISWIVFKSLHYLFPDFLEIIIPIDHQNDILILAFLNAIMLTNYNILLGNKRIGLYNVIFGLQIFILLTVILVMIYVLNITEIEVWIYGAYGSYAFGAIVSLYFIFRRISDYRLNGVIKVISSVIGYGFITQIANLLHVGNKRIGLYFLKAFTGIGAVGIYGAGTQLTEGLRLIGQSISLVQFTEISNSKDGDFAKIITIKLMKFSVILTVLAVIILIAIPVDLYELIFGVEFTDLKKVILALGPGVIALSSNTIFSHYFSGLGRPSVSLVANLIGLAVTVILAIVLIPLYGITGAAATASASYISTVIYQYFLFRKETGTSFSDWLPKKNDITLILTILKNFRSQK